MWLTFFAASSASAASEERPTGWPNTPLIPEIPTATNQPETRREATADDLKAVANRWLSDGVYILEVLPFPDLQAG
jgi:hypothetical protein